MATVSFALVSPQQVIGTLKATGSRDPDVLFATKLSLLEPVKPLTNIGVWACVTGALMTALILTAYVGVPLLVFGWWTRRRGRRNIDTIEMTFAEYLGSLGLKPRPAA